MCQVFLYPKPFTPTHTVPHATLTVMHTQTNARTQSRMPCTQSRKHTGMHARTCPDTRAHTHTHAHMHVCTRVRGRTILPSCALRVPISSSRLMFAACTGFSPTNACKQACRHICAHASMQSMCAHLDTSEFLAQHLQGRNAFRRLNKSSKCHDAFLLYPEHSTPSTIPPGTVIPSTVPSSTALLSDVPPDTIS